MDYNAIKMKSREDSQKLPNNSRKFQGQNDTYNEYLMAMKRVHSHQSTKSSLPIEMQSPRERHRKQNSLKQATMENAKGSRTVIEASRVGIIASMVPDEIIYKHYDHTVRGYDAALMFIDVSGFTDLCEKYTKMGRGGPSRLTQVLNSYIGAMVQEILTHGGDVLKFAGDAFLSMWKKTSRLSMQDVVHTAIDCGLIIQKNYGTYLTDIDVELKVKVAITAGRSYFSIIGDEKISQCHFVLVGQPVWDVKMAQYMTTAGDVMTSASAWMFVNEAEYCTQPCGDGRHTKVLGVGASWKRVDKFEANLRTSRDSQTPIFSINSSSYDAEGVSEINYKEYSLRPAVVAAMKSSWWPGLRRFMVSPVLRAVDNDEPMDFLTEVRTVVVEFLNIITKTVTEDVLIGVVNNAYKCVLSVTSESGGLVNKVSMFDKDMMFLVVFGLRGLKHEDEAQKALLCANHLKETLNDDNILSVSIGVTSGTTYCGVVGHVLRREYTVIGSAVNKAARLMMAYQNKVTCDKETFLRSKLDQEYFKLQEVKVLKGFALPGPVYEFNKMGWPDRLNGWRHPLIGRNEELRKFKMTLQNAIQEQSRSFTRYSDHKYAVAFMGPKFMGKKRLVEECLYITPNFIRTEKLVLIEGNQEPFAVFRLILKKNFIRNPKPSARDDFENRVRYSLDITSTSPLQIHAINTIFDCRFPLPENFNYAGDILKDFSVKTLIQDFIKKNCKSMWVLSIQEARFIDNESWRILLMMMETKLIFFIFAITDVEKLSPEANECLANNMIVKVPLSGVDRCYHAALACQLLDVQAIPTDLEKVIESASGGLPGWIQNFVISLVQRGALTIVTMPRSEVLKSGAVMPSPLLLHRNDTEYFTHSDDPLTRRHSFQSIYSMMSVSLVSKQDSFYTEQERDQIQVAVLAESYTFNDLKVDMTMDAIILKTYDSLSPFEKMLLKCGSVLGEVFSRRMLLHLMQSDSPRKVAEAVAKLFKIRVLECEGGDFTRDTSLVLVHPAPTLPNPKPPFCACLGTRKPPNGRDLPMYAFCGYIKFRHSVFRTTTYDLLTENQKHELHSRALLYLERYTRRCSSCGAGCFTKLLGLRADDGLVDESEELKQMRRQICAFSAETRMAGEPEQPLVYLSDPGSILAFNFEKTLSSYELLETEGNLLNRILGSESIVDSRMLVIFYFFMTSRDSPPGLLVFLAGQYFSYREFKPPYKSRTPRASRLFYHRKRVRSFSSYELDACECLSVLQSVYGQCIDHCRGAGELEKLFEAYMEHTDLCINVQINIPQAVRLLFEVEEFIKTEMFEVNPQSKSWVKDFRLASVCSMRGACMLESGDLSEARRQLFHAMKLYCDPFPTSKHWIKVCNIGASIQQVLALYIVPNFYIARESGIIGFFYEDIAETLSRLYRLFIETKEMANASLAAKWALNYALRTNSNLRLLCVTYGNMIAIYRSKQKFSICLKLEKRAMEMCRRKRGQLDVTEVQSVCYLYTNIFLFYVEYGKKMESLEFGLSVMNMMTSVNDLHTRQLLVLYMLKLLLSDLRIQDMVAIMREYLYMSDHYDLSSETWYYYYAMVILLDTGYCVESYGTCEKFYIKKGDAILRSKTPEAAWTFFVCMWLVTIRIGAWERSILWEEKIRHVLMMKFDDNNEFTMMMITRLVEGLLITLVKEMDNRNIKKIVLLEKSLKTMFQDMNRACDHCPMHRPRYYLLFAYYNYIRGFNYRAFNYLNKARDQSKQYLHGTVMIWVEHTRHHWKKTLNPQLVDYWIEHIEPDKLLDYREFNAEKGRIVPYTLPLPRDFER